MLLLRAWSWFELIADKWHLILGYQRDIVGMSRKTCSITQSAVCCHVHIHTQGWKLICWDNVNQQLRRWWIVKIQKGHEPCFQVKQHIWLPLANISIQPPPIWWHKGHFTVTSPEQMCQRFAKLLWKWLNSFQSYPVTLSNSYVSLEVIEC